MGRGDGRNEGRVLDMARSQRRLSLDSGNVGSH